VITPPTPQNGSPTPTQHEFTAPQNGTAPRVFVTTGPAQRLRSSSRRHQSPPPSYEQTFRPVTSYQLPATALDPSKPRTNFSHPARAAPQQIPASSIAPLYVPPERSASIAAAAERVMSKYAPSERRISHISYESRHTAAIDNILKNYEATTPAPLKLAPPPTSGHSRSLSVPRTPKTPKTPNTPHSRSSSLAPPSPGTPASPVSPARTEFSIALVESAVRMKIMPVYFARRKRSIDARVSAQAGAPLGSHVMKPKMHSFRRSKHARVPSTPALQTHFEV